VPGETWPAQAQGLLGSDFLQQVQLTVDNERGVVRILPPRSPVPPGYTSVVLTVRAAPPVNAQLTAASATAEWLRPIARPAACSPPASATATIASHGSPCHELRIFPEPPTRW
jgi:hypothetical protein